MDMTRPPIQAAIKHFPGQAILYDPRLMPDPEPEHFTPAYWLQTNAVCGRASTGRQPPLYVLHQGTELVLRLFQHGGALQSVLQDRYVWTGHARSRSWREWPLLARLSELGLPVPRPAAASVSRRGMLYSAALITQRIPGAVPLSNHLASLRLQPNDWIRLGALLARFHLAGVDHPDLNAHNILLDAQGAFWLVDFDRGRIRPPHPGWQQSNLKRFKRSLDKISFQQTGRPGDPGVWAGFLAGYRTASPAP